MFRRLALSALVCALAVTAACSAGAPTTTGGEPTFAAPAAAVAGCGATASTDPTDRSATRRPARCEPGSPAPVPLAQREKVTFAAQTKGATGARCCS